LVGAQGLEPWTLIKSKFQVSFKNPATQTILVEILCFATRSGMILRCRSFSVLFPNWDSNIPREIVQPPRKNLGHPPAHAKTKSPSQNLRLPTRAEGAFAVEAVG
jgi:hypothetical protein